MATGTELQATLPAKIRNEIKPAIDELVRVLGGDEDGAFDPATVFPDTGDDTADNIDNPQTHATQISNNMQSAPIDSDLSDALNTLLEGVPGSDSITSALDQAIDWIEQQLQEIANIREGASDRIDAWEQLNNPHDPNTYGEADFGFVPAIEGVINSIANTNADADDLLRPLETAGAALAAADAITIFSAYALGALQMLSRARGG